ncbi:MAG: hypothetical protein WD029_07215 [Microthrixaceae bacterium]
MTQATRTDLWDQVVGQQDAVKCLQAAVESPVHAYLLLGPDGSGTREAARAFAADLLSTGLEEDQSERARHLAGAEAHPAMIVVERDGAAIDAKQSREVVKRASLAPAEGQRQVIVLVDFHLVGDAAAILLKSIEEPPESTVFVILAEELPPHLATIASRCVKIDFSAVPMQLLLDRLILEGITPETAELAARGAGGSLSRGRLLARDPAVGARRNAWYRAPAQLDGTGSTACALADELLAMVDGVMEPLQEQQAEELAAYQASFELVGGKLLKGDLKKMEDRHKREQRRVRTDELRAGLGVLLSHYRDCAVSDPASADEFAAAADEVQSLCNSLVFNPREALALQAMFVSLPRLHSRGEASSSNGSGLSASE